jgi:deoxyribodipyrimidine photo-lyase
MRTEVVLFTRDLRLHDNPALAAAVSAAERIVPLFVLDPAIEAPPNRRRFLMEALSDLQLSLRSRGGDLLVRQGDPVAETVRVALEFGATAVSVSEDYSAYAVARQERLRRECTRNRLALRTFPGVSVVPPGALLPSTGADHYKVFTPYWRAWQSRPWRAIEAPPARIVTPELRADPVRLPKPSPQWTGGETQALQRMRSWLPGAHGYADGHDDLPGDRTSRLSPYLHFGCLSALTLATSGVPEAFLRQLCWRDFYLQVLAGFPRLTRHAYRSGAVEEWAEDDGLLRRWRDGETGVSIVDAGMRQLLEEGWMHNRARLIAASHLTKTLRLNWRAGAEWFDRLLVDADVASNYGNWQWVAGTGTDTRPYRTFNPIRQAQRFDPDGAYVERFAPPREA